MSSLFLYWQTLRHLKPVQLFGRLWFRLYRPLPETRLAPLRREQMAAFVEPCHRRSTLVDLEHVDILNEPGKISRSTDWNDPDRNMLWLYNLHYFDDLNAVRASDRTQWHRALLQRWINENPPCIGVGWEPYPTSLRVVNWVKWALSGNDPTVDMIQSLAVQIRWLNKRLERHLLGNHLLANAKAMVYAGLFFSTAEADRWYESGIKLLRREFKEQILADGGHFERSPMYHLIVLEDILDLINLHGAFGIPYPDEWRILAERMLKWSSIMRHPDGEIPFFNDAAFDVAPTPALIDAYARRLDLMPKNASKLMSCHLSDSGYARMESGDSVVFVDMAPIGPDYLPGHAHADTLSFELSLGARRVVVNGGTSVYGTGKERLHQRSTVSHATLILDGQNSSEVWSGFRVARRARILEARMWHENDTWHAVGMHDGYRRLTGKPIHRRSWMLRATELRVVDEILGMGIHQADIIYPLEPALLPIVSDDGCIKIEEESDATDVLTLQATGSFPIVERTTWHPRFGNAMPAWRVRLRLIGELPLHHETILRWNN